MMNLVAHLPKYPVYTFWYYACIKQTEMVQQSIYSLKNRQFSIPQVISYPTLKHLAKNLLASITSKNASNSIK